MKLVSMTYLPACPPVHTGVRQGSTCQPQHCPNYSDAAYHKPASTLKLTKCTGAPAPILVAYLPFFK